MSVHFSPLLYLDLALAAGCATALARARPRLAGSTLTAAWWWCLVALAAIVAAELLLDRAAAANGADSHVYYAAALFTFGPPMAVLGAKRPQHNAWQWIVASLLLVLAWPSALTALRRGWAPLDLHFSWRFFLAALWLAGWPNYLPTRFRASAALYGLGQAALVARAVGWNAFADSNRFGAGTIALACGAACAWLSLRVPRATPPRPMDSAWVGFRDAFGAVWGLRVAERFNALALNMSWPVRLGWRGIRSSDGAPFDGSPPAECERQLGALLERFVSPAWIARRDERA